MFYACPRAGRKIQQLMAEFMAQPKSSWSTASAQRINSNDKRENFLVSLLHSVCLQAEAKYLNFKISFKTLQRQADRERQKNKNKSPLFQFYEWNLSKSTNLRNGSPDDSKYFTNRKVLFSTAGRQPFQTEELSNKHCDTTWTPCVMNSVTFS